jgi:molybdate transport system substrate-binding protein
LSVLLVLSAGAAQGAVSALAASNGFALDGDFGAVGAMQKRLLDGAPCDVVVLTRALISELSAAGRVLESGDLGRVHTAVAVRDSDPLPDVSSAERLREALLAANEIYFPDPQKATAGIHFQKVLETLAVRKNFKTYPNGATAMREMARSTAKRVIGCTQATEIRNTSGAKLVGPLPAEFQLATVYTAAVCAGAPHAQAAQRFLALLSGAGSRELRREAGFDL